jgi:bacillithiol biosynthesis deacetylase BshB1
MPRRDTIDVLGIGAHPDDVELFAGGTLLRLASLGHATGIVDLTRGEASTRGTVDERAAEAAEAARVLGLAHRETLDLGDARLDDSERVRAAIVAVLRRLRPQLVLTHHPDQPHPDHGAAARAVRAAAYLAGVASFAPSDGVAAYRPSSIAHFGLPATVVPSFVVDVTEFAERRLQAIRCHRSQLHDPGRTLPDTAVSAEGFLARLDARHRHYGALIGAELGEAFLVRETLAVDDPVRLLSRPAEPLP